RSREARLRGRARARALDRDLSVDPPARLAVGAGRQEDGDRSLQRAAGRSDPRRRPGVPVVDHDRWELHLAARRARVSDPSTHHRSRAPAAPRERRSIGEWGKTMTRSLVLISSVLLAADSVPGAAQAPTTVFAGRLLDGRGNQSKNVTVVVDNGRIIRID